MGIPFEEKKRIYEQVDAARARGDFLEADRLRYSIPIDNKILNFMVPVVGRDCVDKMMQEAESVRQTKLAQLGVK